MINMTVLCSQLVTLFMIIAVGYFAYKTNILNQEVNKHLNTFVLQITMPMMIINAVSKMVSRPSKGQIIALFIFSALFYILMPVISFIIVKIMVKTMGVHKNRQGIYMFMMIFGNIGFMGFPIIEAAFGDNSTIALFYAAILNVFFNIAIFTYGIIMIGYGSESKVKISFKKLLTPGMFSSFIAIIMYGLNLHLPGPVGDIVETLGNLTPALSMILVGSTLATMKISEVFNYWRIYIFVLIRQVILPIILYPVFKLVIKDDLLFYVFFIEFLMPVANSTLIFATQYKLDSKFASKSIFISTLFSLITIPGILFICSLFPF